MRLLRNTKGSLVDDYWTVRFGSLAASQSPDSPEAEDGQNRPVVQSILRPAEFLHGDRVIPYLRHVPDALAIEGHVVYVVR